MEEPKETLVTVYYSENKDKNIIECIRFEENLYVNTEPENGCELATRNPEPSTEAYKHFTFYITAEALKNKEKLATVAQRAQEEIEKLPPPAPPAPPIKPTAPVSGIGAGSTPMGKPAAEGYSLYAWIDKHRPEINAKINPQNYSLPDGKYELVAGSDKHKITISNNGEMKADLKSLSSMDAEAFSDHICNDLKAIVDMYKAMHEKSGVAVFPENNINLFVIKQNVNTEEEKIKLAQIEKLVAQKMHAYLSQDEHAAIKDKFTVLGQKVTKPAPAPKADAKKAGDKKGPTPSAPPLTEKQAKKAAETSDAQLPHIITIDNPKITVEAYKQNLEEKAAGTDPHKSAFIFPGNDTHAATNNIHGKKSGGGIAVVAGELGDANIGTLSLPTTIFNSGDFTEPNAYDNLAKSEMAKLWKAVGEGYTLVLPVRPSAKNGNKYFLPADRENISGITGDNSLEPSFWGQNQTEYAKGTETFHTFYCKELGDLQKFILAWNQPGANKKQLLANLEEQKPDFHKAFLAGVANNPKNAPKAAESASNPPEAPPPPPATPIPDQLKMGRK